MRKYEDVIGYMSTIIGFLILIIFCVAGWTQFELRFQTLIINICIAVFFAVISFEIAMWIVRKKEKGEDMAEILEKLEPRVKSILEDFEETRGDDAVLYARYIERFRSDLSDVPATTLFRCHKDYEVPSYESITRIRRKVQTKHPELLPTKKTRQKREHAEEDYKEYSRR